MNTFTRTISYIATAFVVLTGGFGVAQTAFANYDFNNHPADCPTVMISKTGTFTNPQTACWGTSTSTLNPGDEVTVAVYYHNTGDMPSPSVSIKLDRPSENGSYNGFTFDGGIYTNNGTEATGSASVNFSTAGHLEWVSTYNKPTQDQSDHVVPNGTAVFSNGGLSIGTVHTGWINQGVIKVKFRFVVDDVVDYNDVQIQTVSAQNINETSATLRGRVDDDGGSKVRVWFEWDNNQNDVQNGNGTVSNVAFEYDSGDSFSKGISGLSEGTRYYFRACGENVDTGDEDCGSIKSFETDEDTDTCWWCGNDDNTGGNDNDGTDTDYWGDYFNNNNNYDNDCYNCNNTYTDNSIDINNSNINNSCVGNGCYNDGFQAENDINQNVNNHDDDDDHNHNSGNGSDDVEVETLSARFITRSSANLRGEVLGDGGSDVDAWFEYDRDQDDVENGDGTRVSVPFEYDTGDTFSRTINGLSRDTRYYFRACIENQDGDEDCGSIKNFTTDDSGSSNNDDDDSGLRPQAVTVTATDISPTAVTLVGAFNGRGCDVTTSYFDYGTTTSVTRSTTIVSQDRERGVFTQRIGGLTPNTTYYFRMVATNCEGAGFGSVQSFRTTGSTGGTTTTTVVTTGSNVSNTNIVVSGGGSSFLRLDIDDQQETIFSTDPYEYTIEWENLSSTLTLEDIQLEIKLPAETRISSASRGQYDPDTHSLYVLLNELEPGEEGDMTVRVRVRGGIGNNDLLIAQVTASFDNPTSGAQETATDFDIDEYQNIGGGFGASLFGSGFGAGSLLAWMLILFIAAILFLIVRWLYYRPVGKKQYATVESGSGDTAYTPYRPTPRG